MSAPAPARADRTRALHEAVRARLRRDAVQLWLPPYTLSYAARITDAARPTDRQAEPDVEERVDYAELRRLAASYAVDLEQPAEVVALVLDELRRHAVRKLLQRQAAVCCAAERMVASCSSELADPHAVASAAAPGTGRGARQHVRLELCDQSGRPVELPPQEQQVRRPLLLPRWLRASGARAYTSTSARCRARP